MSTKNLMNGRTMNNRKGPILKGARFIQHYRKGIMLDLGLIYGARRLGMTKATSEMMKLFYT